MALFLFHDTDSYDSDKSMKRSFQIKGKEQMNKLLDVISEAHLWALPMGPELGLSHRATIFWVLTVSQALPGCFKLQYHLILMTAL